MPRILEDGKIVFTIMVTGPDGSGKRSFLRRIHDLNPTRSHLEAITISGSDTSYLEYKPTPRGKHIFHILAVPEQAMQDWEVNETIKDMDGIFFIWDGRNDRLADNTRVFSEVMVRHGARIRRRTTVSTGAVVPMVVCVNKMDMPPEYLIPQLSIRDVLKDYNLPPSCLIAISSMDGNSIAIALTSVARECVLGHFCFPGSSSNAIALARNEDRPVPDETLRNAEIVMLVERIQCLEDRCTSLERELAAARADQAGTMVNDLQAHVTSLEQEIEAMRSHPAPPRTPLVPVVLPPPTDYTRVREEWQRAKDSPATTETIKQRHFVKIILAGDARTGRTMLARRYASGDCPQETAPTIGVQIHVKHTVAEDDDRVEMIWDLAGNALWRPMQGSFLAGAHGAIIAFDLSRIATALATRLWVLFLRSKDPALPIILVGLKRDLVDSAEEASLGLIAAGLVANYHLQGYITASALTGDGVAEAFQMLLVAADAGPGHQDLATLLPDPGLA
nr:ADP-ribosylation factor-like protein [Candidatus Sigynarchaeota archaeon]